MSSPTSISNCTNCNGNLTFDPSSQTLDCPFCNTTYNLNGEVIKTEIAFSEAQQAIIPFGFGKEVFDKVALTWLSAGDYTPGDILDSFQNYNTKGVYIPLYVWNIDYALATQANGKTEHAVAVMNGNGQRNWPAELRTFAKAAVKVKGITKAFDQVYTLGFDLPEDDNEDDIISRDKAEAFARETIVAETQITDGRIIKISRLALTKVYVAFWVNKYNYQGQNYEIVMSGWDASKIAGKRPQEVTALEAKKPSFKPALLLLFVSLALLVTGILVLVNNPGSNGWFIRTYNFISACLLIFVSPVVLVVTFIRRLAWTSPVNKIKKEREQKLAQRLQEGIR
jgi:hypothetical protein